MKRILVLLLILSGSLISSCQCSNPPDVPPVDENGRVNAEVTMPDGA